MTKKEVKNGVTEVLALLSSYSQQRIIELIDYSEDTNLQLIALMSVSMTTVLANKLNKKFPKAKQKALADKLFSEIKTAEKLIDYIYEQVK